MKKLQQGLGRKFFGGTNFWFEQSHHSTLYQNTARAEQHFFSAINITLGINIKQKVDWDISPDPTLLGVTDT